LAPGANQKIQKIPYKGAQKIFFKGVPFFTGRKNSDLAPGDEHPCYATGFDKLKRNISSLKIAATIV